MVRKSSRSRKNRFMVARGNSRITGRKLLGKGNKKSARRGKGNKKSARLRSIMTKPFTTAELFPRGLEGVKEARRSRGTILRQRFIKKFGRTPESFDISA